MSIETIATRLEEAGIGAERFIDVNDGGKKSVDHTQHAPAEVSGNYGIYANADDRLVILDVDDYGDLEDKSGLTALTKLPTTLRQGSPHGGEHRLYAVERDGEGRFVAEILEEHPHIGKANPKPTWGEVRVENQYVVGAGSELDGCSKEWCDECATEDGGRYTLAKNREIATIPADLLVEVLLEDPNYAPSSDEESDEARDSRLDDDAEADEILDYALNESNDKKLKRLWRGDYSDYGGDRSEAEAALAYKLAFWLQGDKTAVRRAMDRADTKKWSERPDDSYRESVLEAVDECSEYCDLSRATAPKKAPSYDPDEVERGAELLAAECSRTSPAGQMAHENGHYGYWTERGDDGEPVFETVTNFTLETLEHLETDDGELLRVRVHPAHPMEDEYDVEIHPTVFNETRTFKKEIVRGRTTRYEPGKRSQEALNDLRETVGSQMVPQRTGTEHIGLAGDEYNEWVSPKGTMTADGLAEDPEFGYYAKGGASDSDGGALAKKWELDPETLTDYDEETVARILELLPQTRKHDRGLPILGWFYAAPLRPLIHDWEGEFNLLQVVGQTGTGKTTTLKAYWQAFGMEPDPFSASGTPFPLMRHMSSSSGVPVWIDEYKPTDMRNKYLDRLHLRLREVTKGGTVSKGRADLGETVYKLKAPVVVSGEQRFSQSAPAVRRRAVMTTLSEAATRDGSKHKRVFCELTGTVYEDESGTPQYPEGYDLQEHARAYYRFILGLDKDDLQEMWNQVRQDTADLLMSRDLTLQRTEFQGAQTVLFGIRLFEAFAESVGADGESVPTDDEVADAFEHYASNIGKGGKRVGYDDSFLELFTQAASEGYLERDDDFRFVASEKWGGEILAFHMPTAFAEVKRYVRDYNLEDEYKIVGKQDLLSAFRDKSERDGSHICATDHVVRLAGDGGDYTNRTKCVAIDPHRASEAIGSGFNLRAFGRGDTEVSESDEGDSDGGGGGPSARSPQGSSSQEAATDGGAESSTAESRVPDDAEGPNANAQRLCAIVGREGGSLPEKSLIAKAGMCYDMSPAEAETALEHATTKKGWLIEDGDEIRSGQG